MIFFIKNVKIKSKIMVKIKPRNQDHIKIKMTKYQDQDQYQDQHQDQHQTSTFTGSERLLWTSCRWETRHTSTNKRKTRKQPGNTLPIGAGSPTTHRESGCVKNPASSRSFLPPLPPSLPSMRPTHNLWGRSSVFSLLRVVA